MTDFTERFHHEVYDEIDPKNPENRQQGRTILITGASRGVGLAIALAFATAKADLIVLVARRRELLVTAMKTMRRLVGRPVHTKFRAYVCDIAHRSSIQDLWESLAKDKVSVDTLVLNAARDGGTIDCDLEQVSHFFVVNVGGNLLMFEHFGKQIPSIGKVALNISCMTAHANPSPAPAHAASKAALAIMMQGYAATLSPEQMLILNIHPGMVITPGLKERFPRLEPDGFPWDDGESSCNTGEAGEADNPDSRVGRCVLCLGHQAEVFAWEICLEQLGRDRTQGNGRG